MKEISGDVLQYNTLTFAATTNFITTNVRRNVYKTSISIYKSGDRCDEILGTDQYATFSSFSEEMIYWDSFRIKHDLFVSLYLFCRKLLGEKYSIKQIKHHERTTLTR